MAMLENAMDRHERSASLQAADERHAAAQRKAPSGRLLAGDQWADMEDSIANDGEYEESNFVYEMRMMRETLGYNIKVCERRHAAVGPSPSRLLTNS